MAIPDGTLVPGVYSSFDTTSQVTTLAPVNLSVCIIAQKLATGTAVENKPIQVFSTGDVTGQAGAGSQAEAMARAALTTNRNMELFFVYQDDSGTGVAAVGTLTVTGTASVTASGVVYIGDQRVEILVNNGDDQDAVALAIDTAITAAQDRVILSSTSATNVTTLTARNKGTSGNEIPVAVYFPAVTGISIVTVQPASGANDPVLQDALDSLDGTSIGFIAIQHNDATALTTLENHIRAQSEPTVGQRFKAFAGLSLVDVGTAASRATNVDYERISIGYSRNTATAARTKYTPAQIAAVYGATYTKTSDPALPRNGDVLIGMPVPDFDDLLSFSEANTLLKNGIAVLSTQGNNSVIMRSVSTKTTTNSVTDFTLLDLQITDSLDYFATVVESTLSIQFRKAKITDRVKKAIKSTILAVSYLVEIDEIVRDVAENQTGIIINEDTTNNGQLNITIPAEIVQGLHVISQEIVLIVNPGGNN